MRIYDLKSEDGRLHSFEVDNVLLGRRRACRIAESIPGAILIRRSRLFRDTDDFCEFTLDSHTFIIEEPFGDNSRYWIGSKNKDDSAPLDKVRAAFERHDTFAMPLRLFLASTLLLGAWFLYPRITTFIAQDRCLDSGGNWDPTKQVCSSSGAR